MMTYAYMQQFLFFSIYTLFVELQMLFLHFEMLDMLNTLHGHIHFIVSLMYTVHWITRQ